MIQYFLERGYPKQLLVDTFNQVKGFTRESLLEIKHAGIQGSLEKPQDEVFAISTFHPTYRDFRGVITDNWDLLRPRPPNLFTKVRLYMGIEDPKIYETCWSRQG